MAEIFFLDANIPMYAAGGEHVYKDACVWILSEITYGNLLTAISTEIIQEILHRYGTLRLWAGGATLAASLLELVPIVHPVTRDDSELAIELFLEYAGRGVHARDILHAAVMKNNGLHKIISADQHFDQIEGLTRLDPLEMYEKWNSFRPN